jgi:hypothetical protein
MAKIHTPNTFRFLALNRLFSISLIPGWQPVAPGKNTAMTQIAVSKTSGISISCRPVQDENKQLIEANHLIAQDSRNGALEFTEQFHDNDIRPTYTWLCLVDEYIILASYTFRPKTKQEKNVAQVRSSLLSLRFHNPLLPFVKTQDQRPCDDYSDIKCWNAKPVKYFQFFEKRTSPRKSKKVEFVDIDILNLYSLLKLTVSPEPNGIHSLMRNNLPLDSMIWWDFLFESEIGFVHIWRTANLVEALYIVEDKAFDLRKFLDDNIKRYIAQIQQVKKQYTKYTTYINQYRSYSDVVEHLWKQVQCIDIRIPKSRIQHQRTEKELSEFSEHMKHFIDNSIQYHALAKSLVLNAAFQVESFLNLVIRVGANDELRKYPDVLDKFTKSPFPDRLKNLKFYSQILQTDVDINNKAVKDALELMTMRNKYVHFDESSSHNRLEDLYFDGDFPLQEIAKHRPVFEAFRQMFHIPEIKAVEKAYQTSKTFVNYIQTLFHPSYKQYLSTLLVQNPISYNTVRNVYAVTSTEMVWEFAVSGKKKSKKSNK